MSLFEIVVLNPDDIETHARQRADFVRNMLPGAERSNWDQFSESSRRWMEAHLRNNSYIGYTGYCDGDEACSAGILLYTLPPLPDRIDRLVGHVLNFFTHPQYRRRGFGRELIEYIKVDARKRNITRLFLNAAPMGDPLYRKAGFVEQEEKALILQLS